MARKKKSRKPKPPEKASPDAATESIPADPGAAGRPAAADQGGKGQPPRDRPGINEVLDKGVITLDLLEAMRARKEAGIFSVIIEVNLDYARGIDGAREKIRELVPRAIEATGEAKKEQGIHVLKSRCSEQYLFARLSAAAIRKLVELDAEDLRIGPQTLPPGAIFHIWLDHPLKGLIFESIRTVKADAASVSFSAHGKNIVWAVIDSGIDADHPHFRKHKNLQLPNRIDHRDFTALEEQAEQPLLDQFGHGTHVAGIIAGELHAGGRRKLGVTVRRRDENDLVRNEFKPIESISGMAPQCKLMSLRVMDAQGFGTVSNIIAALEYIDRVNNHGRPPLRIQGVNLSVGNDYDPEWFACGESPLCATVNRLVRSGVVVVAAAGNSGYGGIFPKLASPVNTAALGMTINDPGNAELAITVGSTHRTMPHRYGVSYFSSKGPTGDGRAKPDLLAPGEKIISCRSSQMPPAHDTSQKRTEPELYREESGTSMAAPHVSGVIAAFLSIRNEFIGKPDEVKKLFLETATDLHRVHEFQGRGLVDLMRAIQSV